MKQYAFVGGATSHKWSQERGNAFKDGMRSANLPCTEFKRNIPEGDYLKELADWLGKLPKPCGIFADNDETAKKIVEVCSAIKISIPEEITLVGCDNNILICENSSPTISSVCPDYENAALMCARLLDEQIKSPKTPPCSVRYKVAGIIRRASSSTVSKYDRRVAKALKIIHAKIRSGITVADIAAELNCSTRLLQIKFKNATGGTIKEYMSNVQLENVEMMLKTTSVPIQKIARLCGYGTEASLRMQFRKKHAISMNRWRQMYRTSI
jgi:LacI family transcriptional regulator